MALKLWNQDPSSWKDLQSKVAEILTDCNFNATIELTITTVRGQVEIDVFAERKEGIPLKIICECKYWQNNIPQTVIHAFRSVVQDAGVNHGYIISRKGFQAGAYEAAASSIVTLCTWHEFLELFQPEYLNAVIKRNEILSLAVRDLAHKIIDKSHNTDLISIEEFKAFQAERGLYEPLLLLSFPNTYKNHVTQQIEFELFDHAYGDLNHAYKFNPGSMKEHFDYIHTQLNTHLKSHLSLLALIDERVNSKL